MPKEPTKILYLVDSLYLGGIERQATDLLIALKKSGEWELFICCLLAKEGPFLATLQDQGIPVFECKLNRSSLFSFPFRFARLVKQISPQIVHSHVDSSIPWQVFGCLLGSIKGIIFTQHNDGQSWNDRALAKLRMQLYYRFCKPWISQYTTVSMQTRKNFSKMLKVPENQFEVIYNSVDTTIFKPAPDERDKIRTALGIEKDKFLVGSVARLSRQKGHVYLIEAATELVRRDSSFHFALIGDGPQRGRLEKVVREKGLEKFFTFTGAKTEVASLYPTFDCLALPSISEGFGLSLVEAMACGVPIVASDVGGVPEVIDQGRCGILVQPADAKSLCEGIWEVRSNPVSAKHRVENGLERVAEWFSLGISLQRYEQVYRNAIYLPAGR